MKHSLKISENRGNQENKLISYNNKKIANLLNNNNLKMKVKQIKKIMAVRKKGIVKDQEISNEIKNEKETQVKAKRRPLKSQENR